MAPLFKLIQLGQEIEDLRGYVMREKGTPGPELQQAASRLVDLLGDIAGRGRQEMLELLGEAQRQLREQSHPKVSDSQARPKVSDSQARPKPRRIVVSDPDASIMPTGRLQEADTVFFPGVGWFAKSCVCRVLYTNHRGETRWRRVIPDHSRPPEFRTTQYHPESQWLLSVLDLDKLEQRTLAYKDIHDWVPGDGEIPPAAMERANPDGTFGEPQMKKVLDTFEGLRLMREVSGAGGGAGTSEAPPGHTTPSEVSPKEVKDDDGEPD